MVGQEVVTRGALCRFHQLLADLYLQALRHGISQKCTIWAAILSLVHLRCRIAQQGVDIQHQRLAALL